MTGFAFPEMLVEAYDRFTAGVFILLWSVTRASTADGALLQGQLP